MRFSTFRLSLKSKLFIISTIIILIPVAIISLLLYTKSSNIIIHNTGVSYSTRLHFFSEYLYRITNKMYMDVLDLTIDRDIKIAMFSKANLDSNEEIASFDNLSNRVQNIIESDNIVDSIYICSSLNHWAFGSNISRPLYEDDLANLTWLKDSNKIMKNKIQWFKTKSITKNFPFRDDKDILSCYTIVKNDYDDSKIGLISINIDTAIVQNLLKQVFYKDKPSYIALLDKNNSIISSYGFNLNQEDYQVMCRYIDTEEVSSYNIQKFHAGKMLVTSQKLSDYNWKLVVLTPYNEITNQIVLIKNFALICFLFMVLAAISLANKFSGYILEPIQILLQSMKNVQNGKFDKLINKSRNDEFGQLYEGFNDMSGNLENLMEELYSQEIAKKDIQLKMMYSQINAHFLYNTLDVIHWIATVNHVPDIIKLTTSLAKYYRINLSEGNDAISVADVLEMTKNYIDIYRIKNDYDILLMTDVEERVMNYKVLKYIFQPLIENAVFHGINKKGVDGIITFYCSQIEEQLIFKIIDNGAGMSQNKLDGLNKILEQKNMISNGNFALKNINDQIKLFYGEQSCIKLESVLGIGTTVEVSIPILYKENEDV